MTAVGAGVVGASTLLLSDGIGRILDLESAGSLRVIGAVLTLVALTAVLVLRLPAAALARWAVIVQSLTVGLVAAGGAIVVVADPPNDAIAAGFALAVVSAQIAIGQFRAVQRLRHAITDSIDRPCRTSPSGRYIPDGTCR